MTTQRARALERANEVRLLRAQLKRDLRAGDDPQPLRELLADPPWWLATMRVADLLTAVPGVGQTRARSILRKHRLGALHTIRALQPWQRTSLGLTPRRGPGPPVAAATNARDALRHANASRLGRAQARQLIASQTPHAGAATISALLRAPEIPVHLRTQPVGDLLRWINRWGDRRISHTLRSLQITPERTIEALTARQRNLLAETLDPEHACKTNR